MTAVGDASAKRLRLAIVAQLAVPADMDRRIFERLQGGADDAEALRGVIDTLDIASEFDVVKIHADRGQEIGQDYDAVILGGSVASVNDGLAWQKDLRDWLGIWRTTGRPLLGICGGHQLMAQALGGAVVRRAAGPVSGSRQTSLTKAGEDHWLFAGLEPEPPFQFAHFDYVSRLPEGAKALAMTEGTIAAIDYGGDWLSVQFHPEVSCDRLATLWYHLVGDDAKFEFIPGRERLIANFLRRARDRKAERT